MRDKFHLWGQDGQQFSVESDRLIDVDVNDKGDLVLTFDNAGSAGYAHGTWLYYEYKLPSDVDLTAVGAERR